MREESLDNGEQLKIDDNLRRVCFFIERTDSSKPILSSNIEITQLLREYLNDDDFCIQIEGLSVFIREDQQQRIQKMYRQWAVSNEGSENVDGFIIQWISTSPHLNVHYSLYDDIVRHEQQVVYKKSNIFNQQQRKTVDSIQRLEVKQLNMKPNDVNSVRSFKKINKIEQSPNDLLQKFFIFYSRKQINSQNIDTFNRYQQECNSLNLTKWMRYCKDVGLSRINKKVSVKRSKEIFIKYENKNKQLTFQLFRDAVQNLLNIAFENDQAKVKNQGYRMIGIKDYQSFQRKFQQIGEIVPNYSLNRQNKAYRSNVIVTKTSLRSKVDDNFKQSQIKQNFIPTKPQLPSAKLSTSNLPKIRQYKINTISAAERNSIDQQTFDGSKCYNFLKQITMEPHETIQSKMHKKKVNKQKQQYLNELIHEVEDDPYLRRYNDKQNIGRYRCIANRIDERIQKIQEKY